ncbi:PAS domain S-box protein [Terracidiphilus sp.]|jgi:PAS domain S-box-containing protein|uniref:PAS domain S-box protein n=1 Tax=Terracidiphilus sp. TaxID=1964191 RepID=UPI003C25B490
MAFWKKEERTSRNLAEPEFREIVDSAGSMVVVIGTDGTVLHVNPAAERLLGYYASELVGQQTIEILAPGEGRRVATELLRLRGASIDPGAGPQERRTAVVGAISEVAPSQVPTAETRCRRKDGSTFPVMLQVSALRGAEGTIRGLVLVGLDQSATIEQQQATRESQERYRDLFENSSEMIATLSPSGQFLYANPVWKRSFGRDAEELMVDGFFADVFHEECRAYVKELFRDALDGHASDRVLLRNPTKDGRVLELELSLSRRQKAGNSLAVRCLLRDVTEQKQREHRLALQLAVSQIMAENSGLATAAERVLEVLCVTQEWDLGVLWETDAVWNRLVFSTAWGAPELPAESMIRQSMGLQTVASSELAGKALAKGRTVWIRDLTEAAEDARIATAIRHGMASGWAIPVRVGNSVLAVLEFYCRRQLREDVEALASAEAVAASLGQLLARKREQGRADDLTQQQEVLLNAVADGICGLDRSGRVTFANPAAARLLGASASSMTGKPIHELLHPAGQCGTECPLREITAGTAPHAAETTMARSDGKEFPGEYGFTPIFERGQFSGSVLSFRDISQRYALDRMKDEFLATAGHELRTPLTSIRGALGLLSSGMLGEISEKGNNLLRIALNNSERVIRLINDMLDLEKIQHSSDAVELKPVQLAEIVQVAIEGVQPVADAAGIQLIHDMVRAEISGDADRLTQVLTNLLANAIKFSPAKSSVSVMMRVEDAGVTISVIDEGRGVPQAMLETIFDRFRQVDASDSRQKGGTGLGLAICRTIVTQHGGRIWAERNPMRGTTFRFFLPWRRVERKMEPEAVAAIEKIEDN